MAKKLIVANWKLNPDSKKEAVSLAKETRKLSRKSKNIIIVICPPFPFLSEIGKSTGRGGALRLGAQNVFHEEGGAFTGEVSSRMLRDIGVSHVLIGHSERRALGETDKDISKKLKSALKAGLIPVLCVGEKERDSHGYYLAAVRRQLESAFMGIPGTLASRAVIAYEPVWAVGEKNFKSAPAEEAVEMGIFIRKTLADIYGGRRGSLFPVLYGGSVNGSNALEFLSKEELDGLLVGRESLNPKSFAAVLGLLNKKK